MKHLVYLLLFPLWIQAQQIRIESKMENETAFSNDLKSFENMVYYNFDFVSDLDKKLNFEIIQKEFTNGKLVNKHVYFDSKSLPDFLKSNRVPFSILAKNTDIQSYKLMFKFTNL